MRFVQHAQAVMLTVLVIIGSQALAQAGGLAANDSRLAAGDAQLSSGEYFDFYTHAASAGERLVISLSSSEFDPYLIIVDASNTPIFQEDDSTGQGLNVLTTFEFPAEGSYTIVVTSAYPGETGRYTLTLTAASEPVPAPPAGQTVPPQPTPAPPPLEPPVSTSTGPIQTSHFFLFSGRGEEVRNTTDPTVEVDSLGNVHMVFPAYAMGNAYYAHCPADCSSFERVSVVALPTEGTVASVMLALDANNTPQVLMSTMNHVYYATCTGDCRQQGAWTVTNIMTHQLGQEREVSGEAFALDPQGRPRFIMHSYRAMFGIGQSAPATYYVLCDNACHSPASWQAYKISEQIWQESTLRFNSSGQPRLATVATIINEDGSSSDIGAYAECNSDCTNEAEPNWPGTGLYWSYSNRYVERIDPAISMVLTKEGAPRILLLGKDETGGRSLSYWECDDNCSADSSWRANFLIGGDAGNSVGAGLDLALSSSDQPRFVYTAAENIFLAFCDRDCMADDDSTWQLAKVELTSDLPTDTVIPYYNCSIASWFFRQPSLAIGLDGLPRVAYRAEDISGPWGPPDPNPIYPRCNTGADMTLSRFAQLGSFSSD